MVEAWVRVAGAALALKSRGRSSHKFPAVRDEDYKIPLLTGGWGGAGS